MSSTGNSKNIITLEELYEFASTWEPTPEEIERFSKLLEDFDTNLVRKEYENRITESSLNRKYNL